MPDHDPDTPARTHRIGIGVGWFTPRRRRWLTYTTSGDRDAATPGSHVAARPGEPGRPVPANSPHGSQARRPGQTP